MSALTELYKEIALCQLCEIAKLRTKAVPGEGAENADIMFIGEAPGWHEDQQGRPFVGPKVRRMLVIRQLLFDVPSLNVNVVMPHTLTKRMISPTSSTCSKFQTSDSTCFL